jgi:hypothetical protein
MVAERACSRWASRHAVPVVVGIALVPGGIRCAAQALQTVHAAEAWLVALIPPWHRQHRSVAPAQPAVCGVGAETRMTQQQRTL